MTSLVAAVERYDRIWLLGLVTGGRWRRLCNVGHTNRFFLEDVEATPTTRAFRAHKQRR